MLSSGIIKVNRLKLICFDVVVEEKGANANLSQSLCSSRERNCNGRKRHPRVAEDSSGEEISATENPMAFSREVIEEISVNLKPKVPTKTVCDEHLELRKEILTLLNLQKQLQYKEIEASSHRERSYAAMDRVFASEQLNFGAERPIKKEQKRKVVAD